MTQSDSQAACGAKLWQIFDDGGGNWSLLEDCQPAVRTRKRDVSQNNTTKHKFWNANLHVIMQDPVMFSELSVVSQNIYKYKWMGLKVYLRGMAKFFEQSITSSQDIIIIDIGHEHFVNFCFWNELPTQSFIWICL